MFEHQYVWEKNYGKIPINSEIHHINGDKKDNRLQNLICLSKSEHMKLEQKQRKEKGLPTPLKKKPKGVLYHNKIRIKNKKGIKDNQQIKKIINNLLD